MDHSGRRCAAENELEPGVAPPIASTGSHRNPFFAVSLPTQYKAFQYKACKRMILRVEDMMQATDSGLLWKGHCSAYTSSKHINEQGSTDHEVEGQCAERNEVLGMLHLFIW